jgi:hypothetical protein
MSQPVILINTFTVEPENQQEVVELLHARYRRPCTLRQGLRVRRAPSQP